MGIPRIIHQTWKNDDIPRQFRAAVRSVKRYHSGWEYRLWTDLDIDRYVEETFPDFYPIFCGFSRHIMRIHVFRYLLMLDIGGVYCDLDFEFLRPYNYAGSDLIFSLEQDVNFGDDCDRIANYFIASRPGHRFWIELCKEMMKAPSVTGNALDVSAATGGGFISDHFFSRDLEETWENVRLTPRPVFSPHRVRGKGERDSLLNNGNTYGLHLGAGSWKDRSTASIFKGILADHF